MSTQGGHGNSIQQQETDGRQASTKDGIWETETAAPTTARDMTRHADMYRPTRARARGIPTRAWGSGLRRRRYVCSMCRERAGSAPRSLGCYRSQERTTASGPWPRPAATPAVTVAACVVAVLTGGTADVDFGGSTSIPWRPLLLLLSRPLLPLPLLSLPPPSPSP